MAGIGASRARGCGGHASARAVVVDFEAREGEYDATGLAIARSLDDVRTRRMLAEGLRGFVNPGEIVALPTPPSKWYDILVTDGRTIKFQASGHQQSRHQVMAERARG